MTLSILKSNQPLIVQTKTRTYILLDVLEVRTVLECRMIPIQVLEPSIDVRIIVPNCPQVAFEMVFVYSIEAYNRRVGPNIQFCKMLAQNVRSSVVVNDLLKGIQSGKYGNDILIVCFLVRCYVDEKCQCVFWQSPY